MEMESRNEFDIINRVQSVRIDMTSGLHYNSFD